MRWQLYLRDWYAPLCATHRSINGEGGPLIHTVELAAYFTFSPLFLKHKYSKFSSFKNAPPAPPSFFLPPF